MVRMNKRVPVLCSSALACVLVGAAWAGMPAKVVEESGSPEVTGGEGNTRGSSLLAYREGSVRHRGGAAPIADYMIDDEVPETEVGIGTPGAMVVLNNFIVSAGNEVLDQVHISYGYDATGLDPINGSVANIVVYDDPNNDGDPSDAVLLTTQPHVIAAGYTNSYETTTLSTPVNVGSAGDSFFVGFEFVDSGNQYPANLDTTTDANASWAFVALGHGIDISDPAGTADFYDVVSGLLPFGGNWLIRADGSPAPPACTPGFRPFETAIGRNPGFETGRGLVSLPIDPGVALLYPSWQSFGVDVAGGEYNPITGGPNLIALRDSVDFFTPGVPDNDGAPKFVANPTPGFVDYNPLDWWFGEYGYYTGSGDKRGRNGDPKAGVVNPVSPFEGSRMFRFKNGMGKTDATCDVYQDYDLSTFDGAIAQGDAQVTFGGMFNRVVEDADAQIQIDFGFYDDTKTLMISELGTPTAMDGDPGTWESIGNSSCIPVGTRYLRVRVSAVGQDQNSVAGGVTHLGAAYLGTYMDDTVLSIGASTPPEVPLLNGSFEDPFGLGVPPADWTVLTGSGLVGPAPVAVDGVQIGTLSNGTMIQTTGEAIAGDTIYVLEAYLGQSPIDPIGTFTMGLYAEGAGSDLIQLTSRGNANANFDAVPDPAAGGAFELVRLQHVVPAGDPRIGMPLGVYFQQAGTSNSVLGMDAVHLYKLPLMSSLDSVTVPNFSFESVDVADGATGTATGWSGVIPVYDPLPAGDVVPTDGSQTMRFTGTGQAHVVLSGVSLEPDTNYTLTADLARGTASSSTMRAFLFYGPGPGIVGASELTRAQVSLNSGAILPGLPLPALSFGQMQFTFTTPDAGSLPPASNLIVRFQNGNSGSLVHLDNVRLSKTAAYAP